MYRDLPTILSFLALRLFLIMPAYLEAMRTLYIAGFSLLFVVAHLQKLTDILLVKIKESREFFRYYNQLYIICNVLSNGATRAYFLGVTMGYTLFSIHSFYVDGSMRVENAGLTNLHVLLRVLHQISVVLPYFFLW